MTNLLTKLRIPKEHIVTAIPVAVAMILLSVVIPNFEHYFVDNRFHRAPDLLHLRIVPIALLTLWYWLHYPRTRPANVTGAIAMGLVMLQGVGEDRYDLSSGMHHTTWCMNIIAIASMTTILLRTLTASRITYEKQAVQRFKVQANLLDFVVFISCIAVITKWFIDKETFSTEEKIFFVYLTASICVLCSLLWQLFSLTSKYARLIYVTVGMLACGMIVQYLIFTGTPLRNPLGNWIKENTNYLELVASAMLVSFVLACGLSRVKLQSVFQKVAASRTGSRITSIILFCSVALALLVNFFHSHSSFLRDFHSNAPETREVGWPLTYKLQEPSYNPDTRIEGFSTLEFHAVPLVIDLALLGSSLLALLYGMIIPTNSNRTESCLGESKAGDINTTLKASLFCGVVFVNFAIAGFYAYKKDESEIDVEGVWFDTEYQTLPLIERCFLGEAAKRVIGVTAYHADQLPPLAQFESLRKVNIQDFKEHIAQNLSRLTLLQEVDLTVQDYQLTNLESCIRDLRAEKVELQIFSIHPLNLDLDGSKINALRIYAANGIDELHLSNTGPLTKLDIDQDNTSGAFKFSLHTAPNLLSVSLRSGPQTQTIETHFSETPSLRFLNCSPYGKTPSILPDINIVAKQQSALFVELRDAIPGTIEMEPGSSVDLVLRLPVEENETTAETLKRFNSPSIIVVRLAGTEQQLHALVQEPSRIPRLDSVSATLYDVSSNLWKGLEPLSDKIPIVLVNRDTNTTAELDKNLKQNVPPLTTYESQIESLPLIEDVEQLWERN